jgi:hypothetical protein
MIRDLAGSMLRNAPDFGSSRHEPLRHLIRPCHKMPRPEVSLDLWTKKTWDERKEEKLVSRV